MWPHNDRHAVHARAMCRCQSCCLMLIMLHIRCCMHGTWPAGELCGTCLGPELSNGAPGCSLCHHPVL
jgi:hypothetical protein